jgi:phosphate transport system protein
MRADFHRQLELLRADTSMMCGLAGDAMGRASRGLLEGDVDTARCVATDVGQLRNMHNEVERRTLSLLARHAPVAGDLRIVVTAIHIATDADRMGGLASHVAKLCLRRYPESPIPGEMRGKFREISVLAVDLVERCRASLLVRDGAQAHLVRRGNQAMETLHRELFAAVTGPQWPHGPGIASDVVLLGRFYGRFADHAEAIARRLVFQTSGMPASIERAV